MDKENKITIRDIAEELGVSTTTISRALSGKGRIAKKTRERVVQYAKEKGYSSSQIAISLAERKTFNIGVILPTDSVNGSPFFQNCLMGIAEYASSVDYDIVVAMAAENETESIQRLVNRQKVDGFILLRSFMNDHQIQFLKQQSIPFVLVGTADKDVIQVDTNHLQACKELTSYLLMSGCRKISYLGGNPRYIVEIIRYKGFCKAYADNLLTVDQDLVFQNLINKGKVDNAIENALKRKTDCILCGDDVICQMALQCLTEHGIRVPMEMKIASFHNDISMSSNNPPITTIDVNAKELGYAAGKNIIKLLQGKEVQQITTVNYNILLRKSTQ